MKPLKSCDIILCSGTSDMSKRIIWFNKLTGVTGKAAQLSHVALFCGGQVFESTTLNKWTGKAGVQLNPYQEWLDNYKGQVWVRTLSFKRTSEFEKKLAKFAVDNLGKPYESGIAGYGELLLAGLRLDRYIKKIWPSYKPLSTKNPHCSELDVQALQYMGVCDKAAIPSRLPPNCFWDKGDIELYMKVPINYPKRLK